jgi:CO/xanthine dehydrogenase Mo-binding subunit
MQFAFAAHRAVVDVDTELGLVKVVELATAQDVGKAINPLAVQGQLEGGAAQGLGLAVMEEIQVKDGVIKNASFTDYLLPTILDMPPLRMDILELGDLNSYGLKGGRPPTISSGLPIVAGIRAATGVDQPQPVRPHDPPPIGRGVRRGRSLSLLSKQGCRDRRPGDRERGCMFATV